MDIAGVDIIYRSIIQRRFSSTGNLIVTDEATTAPPATYIIEQPGIQLETTSELVFAPSMSPTLVTTGLAMIMSPCSLALWLIQDL